MCKILVAAGINVNVRNKQGYTALNGSKCFFSAMLIFCHIGAAERGHLEVVQFLFREGKADATIPTFDNFTPISNAAATGSMSVRIFELFDN